MKNGQIKLNNRWEKAAKRVVALVGLAALYVVLAFFLSLGLYDEQPAVYWTLVGVPGISYLSAFVVFVFDGKMPAKVALRAKKWVVGFALLILYAATVWLWTENVDGRNCALSLLLGICASVCFGVASMSAHFAFDRYWGHRVPFVVELMIVAYFIITIILVFLNLI